MTKYTRGGVGSLLVQMSAVYKTGTGIKGLNGQELVLGDEGYAKEKHANTSGVVIQIPVSYGKHPIGSSRSGFPAYGASRLPEADVVIKDVFYARPNNKIKFRNDIEPEIQVGDKVYCPWTAVFDKRNLIAKGADGKSFIFKVAVDLVYAVVRAGKIIPIGSHVLIDPVFESWESILRPTYYDFKDKFGKPMERPKSEWLQVKTAPKQIDRQGIIKHIGSPLKGETCQLKPSMKVLYKPNLKNLLEIEGEKYFIMRQDQILLYSV